MQDRNKPIILFTTIGTVLLAAGLAYLLFADDMGKGFFLSGRTSDAHYQIETRCDLCHEPFGGIKQSACENCHQQELEAARDSHPARLFRDPRNADRLEIIDALSCRSCHNEHLDDLYRNDVTIAADFCVQCHRDVSVKHPNHKGLDFRHCQDCHNYHDNSALYEDYLAKHLDEPDTLPEPDVAQRNFAEIYHEQHPDSPRNLEAEDQDGPLPPNPKIVEEWAESSHAAAGVNCRDCHVKPGGDWVTLPDQSYCSGCHGFETETFLAGKHGIRLAQGLPAMTTEQGRLPFKPGDKTITCFTCHPPGHFDPVPAAVDACLDCHADEHSLAYKKSAHYRLWQKEQQGKGAPGTGVSCATCHLPRLSRQHLRDKFKKHKKKRKHPPKPHLVKVDHNEHANLRPDQKMIKSVCQNCHGLRLILDSLADRDLIRNNFQGQPKVHLDSLEMVKQRL